jgi:hypothetical protein
MFSDELLLDHATFLPLHFLNPNMAVPIVPVILNTLTPPMPSAKRCFQFGEFLGRVLQQNAKRVALIATGGLSHWPGEAKHGKINIPFRQEVSRQLGDPRPRRPEVLYARRNQFRSRLRRPRDQNLDRARRRGAAVESGTGRLRANVSLGDGLRVSRLQSLSYSTAGSTTSN